MALTFYNYGRDSQCVFFSLQESGQITNTPLSLEPKWRYGCALDGLCVLDKQYKLKTFGFYPPSLFCNFLPHKHCHKQCEYHGVISWVEFLWGRKIDHFLPHKNCHREEQWYNDKNSHAPVGPAASRTAMKPADVKKLRHGWANKMCAFLGAWHDQRWDLCQQYFDKLLARIHL